MKHREWTSLKYMNPTELLLGMDKIFDDCGIKKYSHSSDVLRDRRVKHIADDRRCAIFCHGAGQALGTKILFAAFESADYDYVGAYEHEGVIHHFPIQLKEFVPDRINSSTSLQCEISKLRKYADAQDLVVVMHINRTAFIRPEELDTSGLEVKEIWLFGQMESDAGAWLLFGNLMATEPRAYIFGLPAVN